jgi:aldose 1-epimerase
MRINMETIDTKVGKTAYVTLENDQKMIVELTSFGAAIHRIKMPDEKGSHVDMLVAPDRLDDFLVAPFYYGKSVGRASGRLFVPDYTIDDISYPVSPNDGPNAKLHGGPKGFSFQRFEVANTFEDQNSVQVTFSYFSPDREEDFPGNLSVSITYTLDNQNRLSISIEGQSDRDTILNVTNHAYFNLSPEKKEVYDHVLTLKSSKYLDVDAAYHLKEIRDVAHTPFDFRSPMMLNEPIKALRDTPFEGFDNTFLIDQDDQKDWVARLEHPESGYELKLYTTYPSIVVFSHNKYSATTLNSATNKGYHSSITLECQYEPGGIHEPLLNSGILRKNERFQHEIVYAFARKTP